jgi:membrane protein
VKLPGGGGMSAKDFVVSLKNELSKDMLTDWAGAVTYAGVLALFPFLLFLIALASVVISPSDADKMVQQLGQVAPGEVTKIVGDRIRQLGQQQNTGLLTLGAVAALWAASGGMAALMRALNIAYDVKEGRPFWKVRLIAIGMTIVVTVLGLVAALVMVASPPIASWAGERFGSAFETAILWLRFPVAGLIAMLVWALMYYVLPDAQQKFKFITPGSVGGVIVWLLASWAFSVYVSNFGSYDKTYGALGGVIVLLLWMWISATVLLMGAEANAIIEHRSIEGKRKGAKSLADSGPDARAGEEGAPEPGNKRPVYSAHGGIPRGRGATQTSPMPTRAIARAHGRKAPGRQRRWPYVAAAAALLFRARRYV